MRDPKEVKGIFMQLQEMNQRKVDLRWLPAEIEAFSKGALSAVFIKTLADKGVIARSYNHGTNSEFAVYTPDSVRKAIIAKKMMETPDYTDDYPRVRKDIGVKIMGNMGREFFESDWGQEIVLMMAAAANIEI